jgi:hypothetical protein
MSHILVKCQHQLVGQEYGKLALTLTNRKRTEQNSGAEKHGQPVKQNHSALREVCDAATNLRSAK